MNNNFLKGYIGTYKNNIYSFLFNTKNKKFDGFSLAFEIEKPSYLAIDSESKLLFSISKDDKLGGISSFKINDDLTLNKINSSLEKGAPPCYINFSKNKKLVFTANYHHNRVNIHKILENGEVSAPIKTLSNIGNDPHIHYVDVDPDERYICSLDLGLDRLNVYKLDNDDLIEREDLSIPFSKGCGPRHMTFHPNGKFAYVITEMSSEIASFKYNNGEFKLINIVSTLPAKYHGVKSGAAIHIHPSGKYLYASNRGDNSIACFKIDEVTGNIHLIEHKPTFGNSPRDFSISNDGNFIFIGNQDSSTIVVYNLDKNTGKLIEALDTITIPDPVCIKFL